MSPLDSEIMQSRETANHTDPTQADDELSAQKSVKYMDLKKKKKKQPKEDNKIKLHKICMWIYLQVLIFVYFFKPITVMLHQSKAFPFICSNSYITCRYLCFLSLLKLK